MGGTACFTATPARLKQLRRRAGVFVSVWGPVPGHGSRTLVQGTAPLGAAGRPDRGPPTPVRRRVMAICLRIALPYLALAAATCACGANRRGTAEPEFSPTRIHVAPPPNNNEDPSPAALHGASTATSRADEQLPTPADFEAEASEAVGAKNLERELDELEAEVDE